MVIKINTKSNKKHYNKRETLLACSFQHTYVHGSVTYQIKRGTYII